MEPLTMIDESTPAGTPVIVLSDDGTQLLLTKTRERPQRKGLGPLEVALPGCPFRTPASRVFLLPSAVQP